MICIIVLMAGVDPESAGVVERLVDTFHAELGIDLQPQQSVQLPGFPWAIGLEAPPWALERFGSFRVVVFPSPSDAELVDQASGGRPDSSGISWGEVFNERGHDPPQWCAVKRYGRVLMRWWNPTREVNEHWHRLDETMRAAVGSGE